MSVPRLTGEELLVLHDGTAACLLDLEERYGTQAAAVDAHAGELRFVCTTPGCSWSAWVAARFDADGRGTSHDHGRRSADVPCLRLPVCPGLARGAPPGRGRRRRHGRYGSAAAVTHLRQRSTAIRNDREEPSGMSVTDRGRSGELRHGVRRAVTRSSARTAVPKWANASTGGASAPTRTGTHLQGASRASSGASPRSACEPRDCTPGRSTPSASTRSPTSPASPLAASSAAGSCSRAARC